jgi:hypothetical protein
VLPEGHGRFFEDVFVVLAGWHGWRQIAGEGGFYLTLPSDTSECSHGGAAGFADLFRGLLAQ